MTKLSQLKIDPEFQNQINPPLFEETHQLEMNILKEERVLNPIITWNGYIVDGHLGCCVSSVTRSFAELEKAELAERVRSGFSKPSHILLKVPHTVQNCAVTVCTSAQSDCAETHSMVVQKCTPNQRNKNNLKDNHLIGANNARLSLGEYQNVFLTEKEYKRLKADFAGLDGLIEQLSAYIQSTGRKYADHAATLRIWAKRQNAVKKTSPGIPDYTFVEGESL